MAFYPCIIRILLQEPALKWIHLYGLNESVYLIVPISYGPYDVIKFKNVLVNKYVETGDGLVFRLGADQFLEKSSKPCESQNWDYLDQIVCSNGFFDGSLCRIEGKESYGP